MKRKDLFFTFGVASVATLTIVVMSHRSVAQSADDQHGSPAELKQLHRLPEKLEDRMRIADRAVEEQLPPNAPQYLKHVYHNGFYAPQFDAASPKFMAVPFYHGACKPDMTYSKGNFPSKIYKSESYADPSGCEGTQLAGSEISTTANAFFQVLGTNGRSCATCHQPPSGMSVSQRNIEERMEVTQGKDPIFQAIDGANCPNNVQAWVPPNGSAFKDTHSLLIKRGLFRIFMPLPTGAQFTVSAADPYGCNTTAPYDSDQGTQMISVYRRPRVSANMIYIEAFQAPGPLPSGVLLPPGPAFMWDTRELTLEQQADDATFGHGHAQAVVHPTAAQVAQMVGLEDSIFSAQSFDKTALKLDSLPATGGPTGVAGGVIGLAGPPAAPVTFTEYAGWLSATGGAAQQRRASIARGETVFNTVTFAVTNVAGLNDLLKSNSIPVTCSACHSQVHMGNDIFGKAASFNLGVSGDAADHNGPPPSAELPIFTVACTGGLTKPFSTGTVTTNDLGLAMVTGQCQDIGRFAVPQLRGLASHSPYFHNGSQKDLSGVVDFYIRRFGINFTAVQREDLIHFLEAL